MKDPDLKHFVFVYGTLKRGEPNYSLVMEPHQHLFVGSGHTSRPHVLVVDPRQNVSTQSTKKGTVVTHRLGRKKS